MTCTFSRSNPSPRYRELVGLYQTMHTCGEQHHGLPPEQTFSGQSLPRHSGNIKKLIDGFQARTLLDYGAGKGLQYSGVPVQLADGTRFPSIPAYWGVSSVTCYDPGYEPFSRLPAGRFDGVICTDVLEHCPQDDMRWIVGELFSFAGKFVYANIACYPAKKRLANGENAHCTIQSEDWWQAVLSGVAADHPGVRYYFFLERKREAAGAADMEQVLLQG